VTPDTLEVDPRAATLLSETMASIAGEAQTDLERAVVSRTGCAHRPSPRPDVGACGRAGRRGTRCHHALPAQYAAACDAMIMLARPAEFRPMAIGFCPVGSPAASDRAAKRCARLAGAVLPLRGFHPTWV
jgi:hypothetical protein